MYFSSSIFLWILFSMFNTVLFLSQKSYRSVTCSVQMVQAQIIWDTISICSMLGGTYKGNVRQSEISAWRNCRKRGIMPTNNNKLKKNPKQWQNHTKNNKTPNQPSKWKKKNPLSLSSLYCFPFTLQWSHFWGKRPWYQVLLRGSRRVGWEIPKENLESARTASLGVITHTGNIIILVYLVDLPRPYQLGKNLNLLPRKFQNASIFLLGK